MIEEWEDTIKKLQTEYTEEISPKMKVAVLYAMLPEDLQERVLDKCAVSWDGSKERDAEATFNKVREEIKNIAKSRRDMVTPSRWKWTACTTAPTIGRTSGPSGGSRSTR